MTAGFHLTLASWVGERDGMSLELSAQDGTRIAEVFHDDDTAEITVTVFAERRVPIEAMEWLLTRARAEFTHAPPSQT
jgi:hypothetical protein